MKKVFSIEELPHLWMAEAQSEGRNAQGNFYFRDSTIYSYGSHFPIARIVRNAQGEKAVLFTTASYSNTTSRQCNLVRAALDGSPVFNISPNANLTDLARYIRRIESCAGSITARQREATKVRLFAEIQDTVREANRFAEFFGLSERLAMPVSLEAVAGELEAARARAEEIATAARLKREAQEKRANGLYRRAHAADLAVWRETGRELFGNHCLRLEMWGDLLRFDAAKNEIETSRGVRVPVDHAKRAFGFIRGLRAEKREWKRNGHSFRVGHYDLDLVDAKGNVKAGCHYITWSESLHLAVRMEWAA